ncbi:MAG: biotin/lipoyl-binding protein [Oscillospiraceae bacterium]|nr:biotin/lipoyl-binding protein [Oscillospiraceae bacterium]
MDMSKLAKWKRRIPLMIAGLIVLALLGFAVTYVISSKNKAPEIERGGIVPVGRGDVVATFEAQATVQSGRQGNFPILDGTVVKAVHFRVGDFVQKGDVIATFDTASLDEMVRAKKQDYENVNKVYKDYLRSAADAPKQKAALQKQIAALEKTIAALQKQSEAEATTASNGTDAGGTPTPAENAQLKELKTALTELLGNTRLAERMVESVLADNGSVAKTVTAFQNLMGGFMMDPAAIQGMMGGMSALGNSELIGASLQLVQLKVQEAALGLQGGASLESVYKSVADAAESAYLAAQKTVDQLKTGWVAEANGVIREISVVAGEPYKAPEGGSAGISTSAVTGAIAALAAGNTDQLPQLLSGMFTVSNKGMVIEYHPFVASFPLSPGDLGKIRLDQPAQVRSISNKLFDATVSFISPVATEGGGDILSSVMGGASTGGNVEARAVIPAPDASIVIGLTVKLTIELDKKTNVVRIPVSAAKYDEETKGYFVFVYDGDGKRIQKQPITIGIQDQRASFYEITAGLTGGEQILKAPSSSLTDGTKIKIKA